MNFGGPLLGIFACRQEHIRKMPGRVIGLTRDANGHRAFCMTLQTREQHIRREKAMSNICTNESLLAVAAATYLSVLAPTGCVASPPTTSDARGTSPRQSTRSRLHRAELPRGPLQRIRRAPQERLCVRP